MHISEASLRHKKGFIFHENLRQKDDREPMHDLQNLLKESAKTLKFQAFDQIPTVEVVEGDIIRQDVDVIVNTTDKSFSFDGVLSTYIFENARICHDCVSVIDDEIRSTPSGLLKCKRIFHVAIPNFDESMENLVIKILKQADKGQFTSIALPAIGAGNGGWNGKDVSVAMQDAFITFKRDNSNVKLIKVILHPSMSTNEKEQFYKNCTIRRRESQQRIAWTLMPQAALFSCLRRYLKWKLASQSENQMAVIWPKTGEGVSLVSKDCEDTEDFMDFVKLLIRHCQKITDVDKAQADNTKTKIKEISEEETPEHYMDDSDVKNFVRSDVNFESFCRKTNNLVWEEIRIAHGEITKSDMVMISTAISRSHEVGELELRDSAVTAELLQLLSTCNSRTDMSTISELSITGEDDISDLIPVMCKIMKHHATRSLRLSEDNLTDEALLSLRENLRKIMVPTLSSLDVSNNEGITNYKTLAQVLNLCEISEVRLLDCGVTPDRLRQLGDCLNKKLARLDLSYNAEMDVDCYTHISQLLKRNTEFLGLSECDITKEKSLDLLQSLVEQGIRLNALDLSYNCDLRYSGVSVVSGFVSKLKLTELNLAGCNLGLDCIVTLRRNLQGHKLRRLDLSDNSPLHDECLKILGRMVEECPIENLDLSNCALSSKQIDAFSISLGRAKISKLNISDGQTTLDSSVVKAINTVAMKVVDELTMCYENADSFLHCFNDVSQSLRIIYGYRNHERDVDKITFVPKVKNKRKYIRN